VKKKKKKKKKKDCNGETFVIENNTPVLFNITSSGSCWCNNYMGSGARLIVAQNTNLLETINSLIARIAVLEQKLAKVTVSNDTNNIYFTGVNLNVISGSESTDGPVNGLGNIIVGYHENDLFNNSRTSSHNIVVGNYHGYPSYGGIVGDIGNVISGNSLSVTLIQLQANTQVFLVVSKM